MTQSARRLDRILTDVALAAALKARLAAARQAAEIIAPICAEVVPGFDPSRPGCCDLHGGVLRIRLPSSAHSTKLRQAAPRLLARLQGQGLEVNEIKVGVQLASLRWGNPVESPNSGGVMRDIDRSLTQSDLEMSRAIEFSRKLALTFPESDLGRAAARMAAAIAARLARIRESNHPFDEQNRKKNNEER